MNINVRVGTAPTDSDGLERPVISDADDSRGEKYAGHLQTQNGRSSPWQRLTFREHGSTGTRIAGQFILQTSVSPR